MTAQVRSLCRPEPVFKCSFERILTPTSCPPQPSDNWLPAFGRVIATRVEAVNFVWAGAVNPVTNCMADFFRCASACVSVCDFVAGSVICA
jgi:hypothetical protein